MIEDIFYCEENNLALFISYSLKKISKYLNIDTNFIFSSSLNYNREISAENKIINICKILNSNNQDIIIAGFGAGFSFGAAKISLLKTKILKIKKI